MKKIILFLAFCSFAFSQSFMLGSAGGYKKPVMKLIQEAQKQGIEILPTFGHPKQMIAQVQAGKDYLAIIGDDIFLKSQKDVEISNFYNLGEGLLVFVCNTLVNSLNEIPNLKIAYAQSNKTIYGKCAKETLNSLKLTAKEEIEVGFVPQVSTYVKNGDVDCGFVNLTEAIAQKGNFKSQITVDKNLYRVPNIVLATLKACNNNDSCLKFVEFMKSQKAKEILKSYGL